LGAGSKIDGPVHRRAGIRIDSPLQAWCRNGWQGPCRVFRGGPYRPPQITDRLATTASREMYRTATTR